MGADPIHQDKDIIGQSADIGMFSVYGDYVGQGAYRLLQLEGKLVDVE